MEAVFDPRGIAAGQCVPPGTDLSSEMRFSLEKRNLNTSLGQDAGSAEAGNASAYDGDVFRLRNARGTIRIGDDNLQAISAELPSDNAADSAYQLINQVCKPRADLFSFFQPSFLIDARIHKNASLVNRALR
jgi:hypothetical protein